MCLAHEEAIESAREQLLLARLWRNLLWLQELYGRKAITSLGQMDVVQRLFAHGPRHAAVMIVWGMGYVCEAHLTWAESEAAVVEIFRAA